MCNKIAHWSASTVPIPCLEGIAGPLKQITLHGDAIVCIHIVLQLGVVIREILKKKKQRKENLNIILVNPLALIIFSGVRSDSTFSKVTNVDY